MKEFELTPAKGGWLWADWGDGAAWVRFAKDRRGRLARIAELHELEPTAETLRRVPLARIQAAATMRGAGLVQLLLAAGLDEEPEPGMLGRPGRKGQGQRLERRYRLRRPPGRRLDDGFYRDVAHAYDSAVAFGLRPRQAIVADTGAADATVAGWVLEARRRGYLLPAEPGRVSPGATAPPATASAGVPTPTVAAAEDATPRSSRPARSTRGRRDAG
jgi:hypothetical protein